MKYNIQCSRCTLRDSRLTKLYKSMFFIALTGLCVSMVFKSTDWEYVKFVRKASTLSKGSNDYDLDVWVRFYLDDMRANGFNIDSLLARQSRATIRFKDMGPNIIGRADGMFKDEEIDMKINPRWWVDLNPAEKLFVIYHEAGHDFWFKFHGSSWIMSSSKRATGKITYEKIWKMREEYFKSIREGNKRPRYLYWYNPASPGRDHICTVSDHLHLD